MFSSALQGRGWPKAGRGASHVSLSRNQQGEKYVHKETAGAGNPFSKCNASGGADAFGIGAGAPENMGAVGDARQGEPQMPAEFQWNGRVRLASASEFAGDGEFGAIN